MKSFYQINSDNLLIGSVSGSIDDAKLYVEDQIQKHFNIPKKCKFNIQKGEGGFYHFEIHQGELVGSILNTLFSIFDENPDADIYIFSPTEDQYQVYRRPDGSLRTFMRPENDPVKPDTDAEIEFIDGKASGLKPFFSNLEFGVWVSGFVFALALVVMTFSVSVKTTMEISDSGYKNAINNSVLSVVIPENNAKNFNSENIRNIPSIGGSIELQRFTRRSDDIVGKLQFKDGYWSSESLKVK